MIVVTQIAAMLQSAALAFFAFTGLMTVWHLMALGAVQAVINAFDMPARQSFLRQMVDDRADLPNAIALNSSIVNAARLIGPVIAAVLVALVGEGWCFAVDAASYLAVIASLLRDARRAAAARHARTGDVLRARCATGFALRAQPCRSSRAATDAARRDERARRRLQRRCCRRSPTGTLARRPAHARHG